MTFHEALLYSLDPGIAKKDLQEKKDVFFDTDRYAKLKERMEEQHVGAFFADEHNGFPAIKPQPYIIYYIGDLSLLDRSILGIVGPRKMSLYGKEVVESLFSHISAYDIVTISGMAEGVDQLCHSLSMANETSTIAVLGWGLGRYAKRPERHYIQQIVAAGGLVLSEFRLGEQPNIYTFPQRNRLIAGLSDYLFLPEAGKKSWSLITVEYALQMRTPVYATPSSIFSPTSEGILHLIETGRVKPVVDLRGFLHQHFSQRDIPSRTMTTIELTDQECCLLKTLSHHHGTALPSLAAATDIDIDTLIQMLTLLEIKGAILQERPWEYLLA